MPFGKWSSFEDCVKDFVSRGKSEDSAKRICGALKARLEKEGSSRVFSWEGEVALQRGSLIGGKAIHPMKILHPEEWPSVRVYLEDELRQAVGSLVGAPLLLDHACLLGGEVLEARYADGAVEYVAELNDDLILGWIKDGTIRHCSVEYEWDNLEKVDGVAPRGITFTGLALLKDYEPGDPAATVEIWDSMIGRMKEARKLALKEKDDRVSDIEASLNAVNSALAEMAEKVERNYEALQTRLDALENLIKAKDHGGEAVIDPEANRDADLVSRSEVLAALKEACYERVPKHWSYGAYLQNRRLRDLIGRLEGTRQLQR